MIRITGLLLLLSLVFSAHKTEAASFELDDFSTEVKIYRGINMGICWNPQ